MSDVGQRNNIAQEISTLEAKIKEDRARQEARKYRSDKEKRMLISRIVGNTKRLDELKALNAVDKGVKDADRADKG